MDADAGVTTIVRSTALVTVTVVEPDTAPSVAVATAVPTEPPVTWPEDPGALEMLALALLDDQVAVDVTSIVEPSEYRAVAVSCKVFPAGSDGNAGEMAMALTVTPVTVRVVDCVISVEGSVADTVVVPGRSAIARPCDPAAFDTFAIDGEVEPHVTMVVTFWVLPSLYVPVATSERLVPIGNDG
jgi:hypothetical protein